MIGDEKNVELLLFIEKKDTPDLKETSEKFGNIQRLLTKVIDQDKEGIEDRNVAIYNVSYTETDIIFWKRSCRRIRRSDDEE